MPINRPIPPRILIYSGSGTGAQESDFRSHSPPSGDSDDDEIWETQQDGSYNGQECRAPTRQGFPVQRIAPSFTSEVGSERGNTGLEPYAY